MIQRLRIVRDDVLARPKRGKTYVQVKVIRRGVVDYFQLFALYFQWFARTLKLSVRHFSSIVAIDNDRTIAPFYSCPIQMRHPLSLALVSQFLVNCGSLAIQCLPTESASLSACT
jgi:hypothetical protein